MTQKQFLTNIILAVLCCSGCSKNVNPVYPLLYPTVEWERTFGTDAYKFGNSICDTRDNCVAIVGGGQTKDGTYNPPFLMKVDANGNKLWERVYAGFGSCDLTNIVQTPDDDFILSGWVKAHNPSDIVVIKTDRNGSILWSHMYPFLQSSNSNQIEIVSGKGMLIAGGASDTWDRTHGILIKLSANGDVDWQKDLWTTYFKREIRTITQESNGTYIVFGDEYDGSNRPQGIYAMKFDSMGNSIWSKVFINDNASSSYSIDKSIKTKDGNYILIGRERFYTTNYSLNGLMIKLDPAGNTLWKRTYTDSLFYEWNDLSETDDGNLIVVGSRINQNRKSSEGWIILFDGFGNQRWQGIIGGDKSNMLNAVVTQSDGSLYTVGSTSSSGPGLYNAWLIKLRMSFCDQPIAKK